MVIVELTEAECVFLHRLVQSYARHHQACEDEQSLQRSLNDLAEKFATK